MNRNFYLFEDALVVADEQAFIDGLNELNLIKQGADQRHDTFLAWENIWEVSCGFSPYLHDLFTLQRPEFTTLLPAFIEQFEKLATPISDAKDFDGRYPLKCNAFMGLDFSNTNIGFEREVSNQIAYDTFIRECLKYGVLKSPEELPECLELLFPKLDFEQPAIDDIWEIRQHMGRKTCEALYVRLEDIPSNTFHDGIGLTEVLQYQKVASKRLTQEHRISYWPSGDRFTVYRCLGHYKF